MCLMKLCRWRTSAKTTSKQQCPQASRVIRILQLERGSLGKPLHLQPPCFRDGGCGGLSLQTEIKDCLWKRSWATLEMFYTLSNLCVVSNSLIHPTSSYQVSATEETLCWALRTGVRRGAEGAVADTRAAVQIHCSLLPPGQNPNFVWDGMCPV